MFKKCWVTATPGAPKNVHNHEKTHLSMQLFVENNGIFKVEGWKCRVWEIKMENAEENKYWEAPKKEINHPVCQPPRNSTFSWKFPPPRCARKFSHLLDGSSQGKGALRAWQRRKWEHYESLSAILRPGIRCCFFTYPPTGFISRLLLGDKSVVYSLVEGPQHFWVPKHEEKGPCWWGILWISHMEKSSNAAIFPVKAIFVYSLITDPDPSFPVMRFFTDLGNTNVCLPYIASIFWWGIYLCTA